MCPLLVIVALGVIGTVRGQDAGYSPAAVVDVRILAPVPIDPRTLVQERVNIDYILPRLLAEPLQRAEIAARPETYDRSDLNLRRPTLAQSEAQTTVFTPKPVVIPRPAQNGAFDKLNYRANETYYDPSKVIIAETVNPTSIGNETDFPTLPRNPLADKGQDQGQLNSRNSLVNSTIQTPESKNDTVSLDNRASFDGDKCPTGQVRINGKCVESD